MSGRCSCCQFYTCQDWQVGRLSHCFCTFRDMKKHETVKLTERKKRHEKSDVRWTYQTTRGSGQPLTVQCRRTHCFSHTVWERGLITNSGECIRLSTFMRLKCSSCSWIWKGQTPKSKRASQEFAQDAFLQGATIRCWNNTKPSPTCLHWPMHMQVYSSHRPEWVLFIQTSRLALRPGYLCIS